jgi:hypothetical protein
VSMGECFVVTPVTKTLTTTAGADVSLGSPITHNASLTGTAPRPTAAVIETSAPNPATRTAAGGTLTFTLFGPATGSTVGRDQQESSLRRPHFRHPNNAELSGPPLLPWAALCAEVSGPVGGPA